MLPPGRYLVKVHVDQDGRMARDWRALLGDDDFVGQVIIQSAWPEGYAKMTTADGGTLV